MIDLEEFFIQDPEEQELVEREEEARLELDRQDDEW